MQASIAKLARFNSQCATSTRNLRGYLQATPPGIQLGSDACSTHLTGIHITSLVQGSFQGTGFPIFLGEWLVTIKQFPVGIFSSGI